MFLNQLIPPPFVKGWSVIFFGGIFNLEKPFGNLQIMTEADLRIVNLNRVEQIEMLADAQIDIALTTNNEQNDSLNRAGILHCGTGKNFGEASRPLFVKVNEIIVALFNVYAVPESFAANEDEVFTFYLPPDKPEQWEKFFAEKIADARNKADVILVATHWKSNEQIKNLGRLLIDCGADGVLGCYSQNLQGVETYKNRPIIYDAGNFGGFSLVTSKRGIEQIYFVPLIVEQDKISLANEISKQFLDSCRELNTKVISRRNDLLELKFVPPQRPEKKLEPVELASYGTKNKIQLQDSSAPVSNIIGTLSGDFDIEEFKRELKAHNSVIFFMLRNIKPRGSGIEQSAFRRAKLFRKYFDLKVNLVTTEYQNDIFEQSDNYGLDANIFNMYDYFQEINRDIEKPRRILIGPTQEDWYIERLERDWRIYQKDGTLLMYCVFTLRDQRLNFINFFNEEHKKIQRDWYDALGFLGRRQILESETGRPTEVFYYRPDGSIAIHELYEFINDKNTLTLMQLINRKGEVTKTFTKTDDAQAYWFLKLLRDKTKNYFLVGDRSPDWHKTYTDIKSLGLDNVRVIHQLHNVHVLAPFDPFLSKLKPRYRYIQDTKIKSDVILTLTTRQQSDIIKRYNLNNIVILPHSLAAVPRVTDVELNPFKIVQVGRIVEEKGHAKSIEAMKIVLKKVPQATLHFYGSGSLQGKLQELINANRLGDHIKFEGFSENMPAVFASSAMSLLPSTFEGFPLVVQESLQQGCPVVAFDCNYGPADGIEDGVNGYLVPVDDIEAMADRIIKILSEPGLRKKLSENSVKSVEKFYPEVVASKWAELFCKLMKLENKS